MTVLEQETGTVNGGLAYREFLNTHRDQMVDLLVTVNAQDRVRAEAMVDQYWGLAVAGVVKDHADDDVDTPLAELIVNEALGFVQASATNPGLGPSEVVDWGLHQLMLHNTMVWAVFCLAAFGRVLHHESVGLVLPDSFVDDRPTFTIGDTVAAMRLVGPVNDLLWVHPGGCDGCCNMRCKLT